MCMVGQVGVRGREGGVRRQQGMQAGKECQAVSGRTEEGSERVRERRGEALFPLMGDRADRHLLEGGEYAREANVSPSSQPLPSSSPPTT